MWKKVLSICLSVMLVIGVVTIFSSCGAGKSEGAKKFDYDNQDKESMLSFISDYAKTKGDYITTNAKDLISALGEDYDSYLQGKSSVGEFLQEAEAVTDEIYEAYKCVCVDYSKLIANEDFDYYDYDGALDSLSGTIEKGYEGYCENLDDAIEDVVNKCEYLIETAEDDVDYDELSDEADAIYEVLSDGYDILYEKVVSYYDYFDELLWEISDHFSEDKKDVDKIIANVELPSFEEETEEETTEEAEEDTTEETEEDTTEDSDDESDEDSNLIDGMRPEFKAAMDSYESFMNEYVEFMNKYFANPSDLTLLEDYANYISEYADFVEAFEEWENDEDMNATETAYYIEVQSRVSKKLLEITY